MNYKGGKTKNAAGYILVLNPNHPRADANGYVRENILIGEKALGKHLPTNAVVHHVNGSKNSGPLVICQDHAYHMLLHQRMRAVAVCGHANWRKCPFCKEYDDPINMYVGPIVYHRVCRNKYQKQQRAIKKGD